MYSVGVKQKGNADSQREATVQPHLWDLTLLGQQMAVMLDLCECLGETGQRCKSEEKRDDMIKGTLCVCASYEGFTNSN